MILHDVLHLEADLGGRSAALGVAQLVEPLDAVLAGIRAERLVPGARLHRPGTVLGRGAAEHDEIEQRVRTEPVRAVHGNAGRLADRHEPRHDRLGIAVLQCHDLAVKIRRDAAHVVMHRRQHRYRLPGDVHARENPRRLGDARQALLDDLRAEVLEMQVNVIGLGPDAAALANLDGHRAADHVARRQVFGIRRVALHEALAVGIGEIAAFAARAFGDQAARTIDTRRVELHELHVLQRQTRPQHHGVAIAGAGVRRGAGEIGPPVTARRKNHLVGPEAVQPSRRKVDRDDAAARAVLHDQVDREILDVELGVVLQRLLVKRVQHRMAGPVGRRAGALRRALAEVRRHAAERPLVDAAVLGTRKRHAVMLQLDDGIGRFLAHVLDRVLVAEPVRTLDRVVHVPAPVVFAHVAERGADAALRRHGMAARRENLGDAGRVETRLRQPEGRAQAGATGADDDDVVTVIDKFVIAHEPIPMTRIAYTDAIATKTCAKRDSNRDTTLVPGACT